MHAVQLHMPWLPAATGSQPELAVSHLLCSTAAALTHSFAKRTLALMDSSCSCVFISSGCMLLLQDLGLHLLWLHSCTLWSACPRPNHCGPKGSHLGVAELLASCCADVAPLLTEGGVES